VLAPSGARSFSSHGFERFVQRVEGAGLLGVRQIAGVQHADDLGYALVSDVDRAELQTLAAKLSP